jgi:hypothetical protein
LNQRRAVHGRSREVGDDDELVDLRSQRVEAALELRNGFMNDDDSGDVQSSSR